LPICQRTLSEFAPKSPKGDLFNPPSGGQGGEPLYHFCLSISDLSYNNEVYQADKQPFPLKGQVNSYIFSRKEVFQPHLPVRLPCYDLAPVTSFTLGRSLRLRTSGTPSFHGLTGGVYKARERIHRAMADARLLANPASRSRVADSDPN
jgi:hypothetical protein